MEIKVYQGDQVLTSKALAYLYGTSESNIRTNFSRNRERYIEGKHYHRLTGKVKEDYVLRELHGVINKQDHTALYLWTRKGALLHAKSLDTERAWQMYEELIDRYFEYEMLLIDMIRKENNLSIDDARKSFKLFYELEQRKVTPSVVLDVIDAARDGSKIDAKTLLLITEAMNTEEK